MISATRFINTAILAVGLLLCFHWGTCNAQSVTLVQATSQRWAGGVCCRTGRNYNIQLQVVQGRTPAVLDSIWLQGYCLSIAKYNPEKYHQGDTLYINILENLVFNEYFPEFENKCYDPNRSGVSFTYYIKGKIKSMDISDRMKELDMIAYP